MNPKDEKEEITKSKLQIDIATLESKNIFVSLVSDGAFDYRVASFRSPKNPYPYLGVTIFTGKWDEASSFVAGMASMVARDN